MGTPLDVILFLVLFGIFVSGLRIAREYQRAVVFRLGRYNSLGETRIVLVDSTWD